MVCHFLISSDINHLASEETLVIKKAVRKRYACRITIAGGAQVGDGGGTEVCIGGEGIEEEVV